jgi:tRNA(Ile)-lysidine synthase
MHPLEAQILEIIRRDSLFAPGDRVIAGVSGGADSVALLSVLCTLSDPLRLKLTAVYIDHGLRPLETGREKENVAALAERLEAEFATLAVNAAGRAREKKQSLEHAARELRYAALRDLASSRGAKIIATAHTADDQAEEVLMRLLRGSGRQAISGMRTKSGDIARPFLETGKHEILAYLDDRNIEYLEDSSNVDPRFLRNRVRNELIPFLEQKFDPGIREALRKTARNLAEDEKLLDALTRAAYSQAVAVVEQENGSARICMARDLFRRQPLALRRRIVEKLLWETGIRAKYAHIIQVVEAADRGRTGTELHLSEGLRVGVQREHLEFVFPTGRRAWRGRLYNQDSLADVEK